MTKIGDKLYLRSALRSCKSTSLTIHTKKFVYQVKRVQKKHVRISYTQKDFVPKHMVNARKCLWATSNLLLHVSYKYKWSNCSTEIVPDHCDLVSNIYYIEDITVVHACVWIRILSSSVQLVRTSEISS